MRGITAGHFLVVVACVAAGGGWWLQRAEGAALADELAVRKGQVKELPALRAEGERLRRAQMPPADATRLRAERAEVEKLQAEVADLDRAKERAAAGTDDMKFPGIPASEWKNAGRGTPRDALQTALWAAAGGDVDALADGLMFDPAAERMIGAFFDALPPDLRADHRSPERLVAFFTTRDIPLGSMEVLQEKQTSESEVALTVRLQDSVGQVKQSTLTLRRGATGWRLLVPSTAAQAYAHQLAATLGR